ncbi:MAG: hypothetical protein ACE5MH_09910 [Terriglobia bacterium]
MRTRKLPPTEKRCKYRYDDGEQCRAARMYDSPHCFFHDPKARQGADGLAMLEELELRRASDIHRLLAEVVKAVRKKRLKPHEGYALGWLIQLMIQNLSGVEREESQYHAQSYGRVFAGALREHYFAPREEKEDEDGEEPAEEEEAEEGEGSEVEGEENSKNQTGE